MQAPPGLSTSPEHYTNESDVFMNVAVGGTVRPVVVEPGGGAGAAAGAIFHGASTRLGGVGLHTPGGRTWADAAAIDMQRRTSAAGVKTPAVIWHQNHGLEPLGESSGAARATLKRAAEGEQQVAPGGAVVLTRPCIFWYG
jgi:hypothetical protein